MKRFAFAILLIMSYLRAFSQVIGPELITTLDDVVSETSGLLYFGGQLWTHNDSGGEPMLYQIDTTTGAVVRQVTLTNAQNVDWEDVAKTDRHIFVGDIGDNDGTRNDLTIYRFDIDALADANIETVEADTITFHYADRNVKHARHAKSYDHNYDCEAMLAKDDSLFLFSKNWVDYKCYLYAMPAIPGDYELSALDTLDTQGLVCGADYCPETNTVALVGYEHNLDAPSLLFVLSDFRNNDFFGGSVARYRLSLNRYQTEGIAFVDQNKLFISNENFFGNSQALYRISLVTTCVSDSYGETTSFRVYPDPAVDVIKAACSFDKSSRYRIYDTTGKIVAHARLAKGQQPQIDVAKLPAGIYQLVIFNAKNRLSTKFVKQ